MTLQRVLVVDDDERWCRTYKRILEKNGYAVFISGDYQTALRELKHCFYPVVVVDLRLQGHEDSDGLLLIQEMESLYPIDAIHKILVSGWQLTPEEVQEITGKIQSKAVSFMSKGAAGKGFDSLRFQAVVWQAFSQFRNPMRCFLSGEECNKMVELQMTQVSVAMPYSLKSFGITMNMDDVYKIAIKPALQDVGYTPLRADDRPSMGALTCNICKGIQESVMCIADITDWNPNVLFELGLMYGLGKSTVILKHKQSQVPSNLGFALYVEYDGLSSLKDQLIDLFKKLQNPPTLEMHESLDPFVQYEEQLAVLLRKLGKTRPEYQEALIYEQRLNENIKLVQQYGDNEERRSERSEIIAHLNALTLSLFHEDFSKLL